MIKYNDYVFPEEKTRCWIDLDASGKRLICINGYIRVYNSGARRAALDEILDGARQEYGRLYNHGSDRYLNVKRLEPVVYTHSNEAWPPFETVWSVRFGAEDPFFYAEDESVVSGQYAAPVNVAAAGTVDAWPQVRVGVTGSLSGGFELKNNTTGKSISYAGALENGDVVTIDMAAREIRKNGSVDVDALETEGYFPLVPGDNEIELVGFPTYWDLTITSRDRWL